MDIIISSRLTVSLQLRFPKAVDNERARFLEGGPRNVVIEKSGPFTVNGDTGNQNVALRTGHDKR